jgi:hypothetical protein
VLKSKDQTAEWIKSYQSRVVQIIKDPRPRIHMQNNSNPSQYFPKRQQARKLIRDPSLQGYRLRRQSKM